MAGDRDQLMADLPYNNRKANLEGQAAALTYAAEYLRTMFDLHENEKNDK